MSRQVPWRRVLSWLKQRKVLGRFGLLIAAVVVVVAGIYVVFWPLSDLIARHDVGAITGPHRAAALQAARDAARGRLLAFGAGLFAAGALVYTGRNFALSRRTFELTEQGHVTDRYTKAIEQLGSNKLDVRIGGIYALERIARDSARDHPMVMEVLTAFVRDHSREQWPPSADDEPGAEAPRYMTRPDVQAAVTVIGRRRVEYDRWEQIPDRVTGAFRGFIPPQMDLSGASLTGAHLIRARLPYADLHQADLTEAILVDADLTDANLRFANLTRAYLSGADLTAADYDHANLTGVDLTDVNFDLMDLTGADFTDALWPPGAPVPTGWQRDTDSGRLMRADTDSDGAATV